MEPMQLSPIPSAAADNQPVLATCSPFVGRVGELARIRRVLLSRRGPRGVLIAGPSGIGKTRLLDEAPALAPRRRLITLHPHAEAAVSGHGTHGTDPHRSPATARTLAELTRLAERDPADAWLLSVDDAQLLGPELWPLLHEAARHPTGKLLVSVTTDGNGLPPELLALWSDRALVRMDLQPLDATGVKELTDSLLEGGLGQTSAARLAQWCDGSPRLLREVARAAVEQGLLVRSEGCWHFAGDRLPVPPSVLELVEPQLRDLDEAGRVVLELVALAGSPRLASVEQFCDTGQLEELERRNLLRVVDGSADPSGAPRVRIAHPLASYAMSCGVPPLRRRRRLRDWVTAHQGLTALMADDDCLRLAEWHLEAHETPPRALLDRAIEQSLRDPALPSAVRLTWAAWRHYPGTDTAELHARALTASADFPRLAAFLTTVRACGPGYARALERAEAHSMLLQARYEELDRLLPRLPAGEQAYFRMTSRYFQGGFGDACALAGALRRNGPAEHALEAGLIMMGSLCHMGRPEQALSLYATLRAELDGAPGGPTKFHADSLEELHASALHYCGRFDEAERIHWREYAQAVQSHHVRIDAQRGLALGHLLHDRGTVEAALKYFTFTSSYRVGWRQWQVKAGIHAALAVSCLPADRRPDDPLPDGLTAGDAGHCAMFLAVVQARRHHERGDTAVAERVLHGAVAGALADGAHADAAIGLHECARLSLPAPERAPADLHLEGAFLPARWAYAEAYRSGEPKLMGRVARAFADMGAGLFAAEAYAELARFHQRSGGTKAATAATARARELLRGCGPVDTPPLRFLGHSALLSDRERLIAGLAAGGLSDKEVAERLSLSVRTVNNHLYRVYRKVGAANRRDLRTLMTRRRGV
ncbi:LuxR C-terminal-related transcriptional regulator [Streptomyces decoyicus]|uniref:LuxR C-terminal-related transcriptional regulator n=1 Tax=Streptomyces decoyicus TaxID=249567 RepID=A0ABZ1FRT8_9ACTN|nr:LuxR C-terminal-related transcriptional regulator [Streptomyces decoyicus]WSB73070.1 LuxR C-terminal-related transcriptional regulator [Streptomyces decoyicus]